MSRTPPHYPWDARAPSGDIRLARPPSTRKKSFLSVAFCGARSTESFAVKYIQARGNHDRRSHQRIGVRHIAEYRIAERDNPDELAIDERGEKRRRRTSMGGDQH